MEYLLAWQSELTLAKGFLAGTDQKSKNSKLKPVGVLVAKYTSEVLTVSFLVGKIRAQSGKLSSIIVYM